MSETALPVGSADGAPSKNALKKQQKEEEKARKKAEKAKAEQEKKAAAQTAADEDPAKENYGARPKDSQPKITRLENISEHDAEKEVTVTTRIHTSREQSAKLAFLVLRSIGMTIQAVMGADKEGNVSKQMIKWVMGLNIESVVRVTAVVKKVDTPVTSTTIQNFELHVMKVYAVSLARAPPTIQVKDLGQAPGAEGEVDESGVPNVSLSTRLDNRIIDFRHETNKAILAISAGVKTLFAEFMSKSGATWVDTPKLVNAATEGGADVFEVKYFNKKAYLAQSPQFYKQMLISGDERKVFCIGPVYRSENSNTHRHLTEFTGLDFEMTFDHHYHEVLGFGEELLVFILNELQKRYTKQIAVVQKTYPKAGDFKVPKKALRLKYLEGVQILKDAGVDVSEQERMENDLTTAMEKHLGQLIREKYDTDFYVLDEFPMSVRPFYTKRHPEDPKLSNSYDFFMRGEEIMSGAQRINDIEELEKEMRAKGLDPTAPGFADYVNGFSTGAEEHAGGGLGLERIVMFFLGVPNIRQAASFARDPQRLTP